MNDSGLDAWMIRLYIFLAAAGGAVTGALVDKTLTLQGKISAFFVGLTASIFVVPLILNRFIPGTVLTPEAAGIFYLTATCANVALPPLIRFVSKRAGDPLAFLRAKGGDQ